MRVKFLRVSIALLLILGLLLHRAWRALGRMHMQDAMFIVEDMLHHRGHDPEWSSRPAQLQEHIEACFRYAWEHGIATTRYDANGRPVDEWGTPFRAELRGDHYEIVAAGPDRIFGTPDDVESDP